MAQNITIANASYSSVPAIDVPKTGGGTATFIDITDAPLMVTVSWSAIESQWEPDTALADVRSAYQAGREIAVQSNIPGGDVVVSGNYDDEHDWFVYIVRASMGGPIYEWNYRMTSGGVVEMSYREAIEPDFETVNKTYTPTLSTQTETVTFDSDNYNGLQQVNVTVNAMPSGSATPAASITGTSATVSTGTNTLTLSKTVSNTPQVSAGYVSSGTAGNSSVSLTANVTTKAAATITPTTSNQTIASGTYLTGTQTISGDANLVAGNIKSGTTIFGVTGTYSGGSNPVKTKTGTFTGNGTRTIDVTCDFEPDLVYVTSDPGTSASSGTVAFIIARDMMAATRYRNNSTTNSHYAVTPCVNLNTSGSSYSWRATYANSKVTLYCFSNGARALLTNGRTYTYQFVKWTT